MKILGIGQGRTGTQSLARALRILGYKTKHCPGFDLDEDGELCVSREDIEKHEALTDEPCILIFRDVDRDFPGSKFILTVRELDAWLRSKENNFLSMQEWRTGNAAVPVLFEKLYGTATFDRSLYADAYRRHVAEVDEYFQDRPGDLLVMDIGGGEGWEKLCPFLGRPVPAADFPYLNVTGKSDWATVAKRRGIRPGEAKW